jgi:GntR family transcriptional repressor for pyruvate dehydrogenase complex
LGNRRRVKKPGERHTPRVLPFRPPARRLIHQDVAEQLRDAILDGRFAAGEKLPPERELADEFQVNRTSVREAIKVLEGLGLVKVRQGDGATVQPLVDASFDVLPPMIFHGGRLDATLLADLGEVMIPLLVEMGRLAIERHTAEQIEALRALRDRVADLTVDREARGRAMREVLVLASDMSGNRVWQMLARRAAAFLAAEPLQAARGRMGHDASEHVPMLDACLEALDAGRPAHAIAALQQIISQIGASTLRSSDAAPAAEKTTTTKKTHAKGERR